MKRTFNYTGRKSIFRTDVSLMLRQDRGAWWFDAELRLSDYHFPNTAEVWIEAHRGNLWMQFAWGTIAALRPPTERALTEFDVPDGVLFRVRVVQPPGQEHHKLLGEADGLHFVKAGDVDDRRRHLLEPVPDALDQQLWKLNFESDPPQLLVNKDAKPSWKEAARSPHFIALVYPEVMRRLLTRTLIEDEWTDDEDENGWQADWIRFARNLAGLGPPPHPELRTEREGWIEDAVSAFARRNQLCAQWNLASDWEGQR